jgi:hypothetical protein
MNPTITVLLEIYARKVKNTKKPITSEIKVLQSMKNNHMDYYIENIRKLCSLHDPQNYMFEHDELIDTIGKHEYVIIEILRELIEKL